LFFDIKRFAGEKKGGREGGKGERDKFKIYILL